MNEDELVLVVAGLNELITRFKRNENLGDDHRLRITLEAKRAIRKVILAVAIKGDVKDITPVQIPDKGFAWEVTDFNNKIFCYFA